jgi:hypothetical protein
VESDTIVNLRGMTKCRAEHSSLPEFPPRRRQRMPLPPTSSEVPRLVTGRHDGGDGGGADRRRVPLTGGASRPVAMPSPRSTAPHLHASMTDWLARGAPRSPCGRIAAFQSRPHAGVTTAIGNGQSVAGRGCDGPGSVAHCAGRCNAAELSVRMTTLPGQMEGLACIRSASQLASLPVR